MAKILQPHKMQSLPLISPQEHIISQYLHLIMLVKKDVLDKSMLTQVLSVTMLMILDLFNVIIHFFVESDTTNVQTNITGPRFALVNITVMFSVSNNVGFGSKLKVINYVIIYNVHDLFLYNVHYVYDNENNCYFLQALHNLTHNWTLIDQNASQVYCSKEDNKLAINFTKPGTYKVLVSINYDGSMYILSHITTVESKLYT